MVNILLSTTCSTIWNNLSIENLENLQKHIIPYIFALGIFKKCGIKLFIMV